MLGWVAIFSVVRGTGAAAGTVVAAAWTGGGAAAAVVLSPAAAFAPPGRAAGAPPPVHAASSRATAAIGPGKPCRAIIDPSLRSPRWRSCRRRAGSTGPHGHCGQRESVLSVAPGPRL